MLCIISTFIRTLKYRADGFCAGAPPRAGCRGRRRRCPRCRRTWPTWRTQRPRCRPIPVHRPACLSIVGLCLHICQLWKCALDESGQVFMPLSLELEGRLPRLPHWAHAVLPLASPQASFLCFCTLPHPYFADAVCGSPALQSTGTPAVSAGRAAFVVGVCASVAPFMSSMLA